MKLFYTKKDRELVDSLKEEILVLRDKIEKKEFIYLKQKNELQDSYNIIADKYDKLMTECIVLKHKYKQMIGRCAGLTREKNKLKNNMEIKNEKEK